MCGHTEVSEEYVSKLDWTLYLKNKVTTHHFIFKDFVMGYHKSLATPSLVVYFTISPNYTFYFGTKGQNLEFKIGS